VLLVLLVLLLVLLVVLLVLLCVVGLAAYLGGMRGVALAGHRASAPEDGTQHGTVAVDRARRVVDVGAGGLVTTTRPAAVALEATATVGGDGVEGGHGEHCGTPWFGSPGLVDPTP
jgi:hypothetical protein